MTEPLTKSAWFKGLGTTTTIGGSLLVMAVLGSAILTALMGLIVQARHSTAPAYVALLPAYLVIAGYAFAGVKVRNTSEPIKIQ